jgi:hypothetical protein
LPKVNWRVWNAFLVARVIIKQFFMQEIIERLTTQAGLSPEQAQKAVETIADFVKEKFPMLGGAVDQIFTSGGSSAAGGSGFGGFGGLG